MYIIIWGFSTKCVHVHMYIIICMGSSRYVRTYICTLFLGSINISLPSTYVRIIIWGFSTKYVHMYIIIWDLLHQVGTYVRTYVHYFWGLLIFLYQVCTNIIMYIFIRGLSIKYVRTWYNYREILIDPRVHVPTYVLGREILEYPNVYTYIYMYVFGREILIDPI